MLDANPFEQGRPDDVGVELTMVGGEIVFEKGLV